MEGKGGTGANPAFRTKGSPNDWNVQPEFETTDSDPDPVSTMAERQTVPRGRSLSCLPEI